MMLASSVYVYVHHDHHQQVKSLKRNPLARPTRFSCSFWNVVVDIPSGKTESVSFGHRANLINQTAQIDSGFDMLFVPLGSS